MNIESHTPLKDLKTDANAWVNAFIDAHPFMRDHIENRDDLTIWFASAIQSGVDSVKPYASVDKIAQTVGSCTIEQQQDEMFCAKCGNRWDVDDFDEDTLCGRYSMIEQTKAQLDALHVIDRWTPDMLSKYDTLQRKLNKLYRMRAS